MESLNINQITLAWLNSAKGISRGKILKLLEYFGSVEELWDNFEGEKYNLSLRPETISYLSQSKNNFQEKLLERLRIEKAKLVTVFDEEYPKKLKEIDSPPYILYYKGSLEKINNISIAVVGSRKATAYGKWCAQKLTHELAEIGVNIVSGLAVGIDSIAHKAALEAGANTYGVIGCGINVVYPKRNAEMYRQIIEKGGAVISEYYFNIQPFAYNFHDRNRIISGLSEGVLVIEAQERSGTLITAGHAANQGREIFAVPGNIDSLYSKATNGLIRDGAKLTASIDDIVEEILELKVRVRKQNNIDYSKLSDNQKKIIACIKSGFSTIDELEQNTNIQTGELLSQLTLLEMKGIITQTPNKFLLNRP